MASFLDYYKIILDKVSFDPVLFRKEYQKAKQFLCNDEIQDLNGWLKSRGLENEQTEHSTKVFESGTFRQNVLS
jgi:hypothetical protein